MDNTNIDNTNIDNMNNTEQTTERYVECFNRPLKGGFVLTHNLNSNFEHVISVGCVINNTTGDRRVSAIQTKIGDLHAGSTLNPPNPDYGPEDLLQRRNNISYTYKTFRVDLTTWQIDPSRTRGKYFFSNESEAQSAIDNLGLKPEYTYTIIFSREYDHRTPVLYIIDKQTWQTLCGIKLIEFISTGMTD